MSSPTHLSTPSAAPSPTPTTPTPTPTPTPITPTTSTSSPTTPTTTTTTTTPTTSTSTTTTTTSISQWKQISIFRPELRIHGFLFKEWAKKFACQFCQDQKESVIFKLGCMDLKICIEVKIQGCRFQELS